METSKGFHVWEYLEEAMQAQGHTLESLAEAMGGDPRVNLLTLYLVSGQDERLVLGQEAADGLGKALGTSSEVWLNFDTAWRKANGLTPAA